MDKLFDNPSCPISHQDVRAAVADKISLVMYDPVVDAFRSLHQMSADEIAHFNPLRPSPPGGPVVDPDGFDYSSDDSLLDREKLRLRTSPKYYYTIGDYESSSFYCEFLSDEVVRAPSGRMVSVREITEEISGNPKSSFCSWFRMPLYKVTDIVSRFLAEGWIGLSHHCRSSDRLQIKTELLVLGSLAMLEGTLQSFRQLKPLTHISASDHSNFFLFKYRDVKTCGQIFLTCAVLHNMMLSEMVREGKPPRLQRGVHLASNGIWIEGPSDSLPVPGTDDASRLREAFHQRRMQLCHHLRIWCDMNRENK